MRNPFNRGRHEQAVPGVNTPPRIPFFKDERFLRIFTLRWLVALIAGGLIVFLAITIWGIILLFDQSSAIKRTQTTNHTNNLLNQQQTDTKFRNLVCFAIEGNDTGKAHIFRVLYKCPDANVPFTPAPLPTKATPVPTVTKTVTKTPQALPAPTVTRTTSAIATVHATATATITSHSTRVEIVRSTQTVHAIATQTQHIRVTATRTVTCVAVPIIKPGC